MLLTAKKVLKQQILSGSKYIIILSLKAPWETTGLFLFQKQWQQVIVALNHVNFFISLLDQSMDSVKKVSVAEDTEVTKGSNDAIC